MVAGSTGFIRPNLWNKNRGRTRIINQIRVLMTESAPASAAFGGAGRLKTGLCLTRRKHYGLGDHCDVLELDVGVWR
jgi:hypothetical protein